MAAEQEGVIKFRLKFERQAFVMDEGCLSQINHARSRLIDLGLLGQDPDRYEGLGFGNVSLKHPLKNQFYITGTQTGEKDVLDIADLSLVHGWDIDCNSIVASGLREPSSEALTHAAVYSASSLCACVIHGHCPEIWQKTDLLGLPCTPKGVTYGTPDMARFVADLVQSHRHRQTWVFSMLGHEDGIVAVSDSLTNGVTSLETLLRDARELR